MADRPRAAPPSVVPSGSSTQKNEVRMRQSRVELDIFSGRKNPTWWLLAVETRTLTTMLQALAPAPPTVWNAPLGYRGFIVVFRYPEADVTTTIKVYQGIVKEETNGRVSYHADPGRQVEHWLLNTASSRLDQQLYAEVAAAAGLQQ